MVIVGPSGAGKTTVFRMLTGELEPDEGEVQIAAGRRVGLISQIPVYPEGYTVEDVLQTAFARMFRMKHTPQKGRQVSHCRGHRPESRSSTCSARESVFLPRKGRHCRLH